MKNTNLTLVNCISEDGLAMLEAGENYYITEGFEYDGDVYVEVYKPNGRHYGRFRKSHFVAAKKEGIDFNKAIQHFMTHPDAFKRILGEVSSLSCGFKTTPATMPIAKRIRAEIGDCFEVEPTDEDLFDGFWKVSYEWAARKKMVAV